MASSGDTRRRDTCTGGIVAGTQILGLHHVTALCGDAQRNVDFYTRTLGLRLVKLTVNPEEPGSYHIYYGDAVGSPGSLISFLSKPRGPLGARGVGMFTSVAFAVPNGALSFWRDRLVASAPDRHRNPHGEECLTFDDPDGLRLHFVERVRANPNVWTDGGIAAAAAITGLDGLILGSRTAASKQFMPRTLGLTTRLESQMQSGNLLSRYDAGDGFIDVMPTEHRSLSGRGTIHHAALRVADEDALQTWWTTLTERGTPVSEIRDRIYYKAIYFREPGGALISLATDKPGLTCDEKQSALGTHLCIPESLMSRQTDFARLLPPLKLPVGIG
ncbi:MAG: VOC family protein [Fimbriimonadaceae bacterium]